MLRKMLLIFGRDIRVSMRDFMSLFMMVIPILLAIGVNFFAPGIEDTTVNLAFVRGQNPAMAEYLKEFAHVQEFDDVDAVEARVLRRDHVIGIVGEGQDAYILTQGNEPDGVVEFASLLKTFAEFDRQKSDSTTVIKDFGIRTPPVKMLWANMGILLVMVLAGMLIALNIVDEKMDNTISAINVAPISRLAWIFGKSLTGVALSLIGCVAMVLILGIAGNVNFIQLLIFVFIATLISIMIGFLQGLNSDDMMTAVASTKMIMLPLAASVAGYEFLASNWQWILYWSPFYWIYRGNIAILNGDMTWLNLLFHGGIVLLITAVIFAWMAPRIRRGMEH